MLSVPRQWLIAGGISTVITLPVAYAVGLLFGLWWGVLYGFVVSFACTWWAIERVKRRQLVR